MNNRKMNKEILKIIDEVKELIKNDTEKLINIYFYGGGDSFEEWMIESNHENHNELRNIIDPIVWYLIDNSDANFNNDGSNGRIQIDTNNNLISINVTHNITTTEQGDYIQYDLNELDDE